MPVRFALGATFAALAWWLATGAILYLDGRPRRTYARSMIVATAVLAAALAGINASSGEQSVTAALCAFACAIAVWGWIELSFLTGFLTGPRRAGCARGCTGWRHAWHATEAILHHELAIAGLGGVLWLITRGQPNTVALTAYTVLWVMRLSAKLNLFLGVRNLGESFLPEHLAYLGSFLRRRPMNPLFPVSVVGGALAALAIGRRAFLPGASAFDVTSAGLIASLLTLAVVEHAFMMLPFTLDALWGWGFRSRVAAAVRPRV